MKRLEKLIVGIAFLIIALCILSLPLILSGCGSSGGNHGSVQGAYYVATSFKSPDTANAELSRVKDRQWLVKFRTGIHPDSNRGPVIVLNNIKPEIAQLFDGSDWRTDWFWYRANVSTLIFFLDEDMPKGLDSIQAEIWLLEQLPITVEYKNHWITLIAYDTDEIGTKLKLILEW